MANVDDFVLISVDDHLIEPPDLFVTHLPAKHLDHAPKLVRGDDGADRWTFRGVAMETVALNAVAGRPKEEYGMEPNSLDEVRPGCYDVHERIKDMDAGGVLASMNFPSFPTFTARIFAPDASGDTDLSIALVRAYNDWHLDDWCAAYPGRFIPMAVPAIWDPQLTADEIRRCAAKGCHSLSFTENPASLGYPSFHSDHWDPVWQACVDTGTVVAIHLGSSGKLAIPAADSPPDVMITLQPMNIQSAAADLLWSRVLKNYPDIRIALSEGGTGWIPYFLDRLDRTYEMHHLWTQQDFGGRLPSEVFREHFLTCFISDPVGVAMRDDIGIDNIAWEADYPHSDSMWPSAPEELGAVFDKYAVPQEHIDKITHENAMRWFSFDPFAHAPKAESTVGALRARAAGHDVAVMARGTRVRTPDEKLEGFRRRAAAAASAGR
ncbi:MAG: amidohydrolase [Actinobacteria bacterium]|nr:amidohydrolase [Actinomycetota bacterium]MBV9254642.1 amidohydrolase [Actinomycetota bacterium]